MTVQELIDRLSDYDPDAEVRLATQPSYPLQANIRGVCAASEVELDPEDDECAVYVVEGQQCRDEPYAPRDVFEVAS